VPANHAEDAKDFPDVAAADRRHLEETRRHADLVRGCIERLGESPSTAKSLVGQMLAAGQSVATGAFRDEVVKNFLSDYAAQSFEIASYRALIAAANGGSRLRPHRGRCLRAAPPGGRRHPRRRSRTRAGNVGGRLSGVAARTRPMSPVQEQDAPEALGPVIRHALFGVITVAAYRLLSEHAS
jgi:hypothetical protein